MLLGPLWDLHHPVSCRAWPVMTCEQIHATVTLGRETLGTGVSVPIRERFKWVAWAATDKGDRKDSAPAGMQGTGSA